MPANFAYHVSPQGAEYVAPHGSELHEPVSVDDKAARPLVPPRTPLDVYAAVCVTPQQVQALRPRWSLNRARAWLVRHEQELTVKAQESSTYALASLLTNTAGAGLQRDRAASDLLVPFTFSPPPSTV